MNALVRSSTVALFSVTVVLSGPGWSQPLGVQGLSLDYLEQQLVNGVSVSIADVALQQRLEDIEIAEAQSGLKVYGGAHYANNYRANPNDNKEGVLNSEIGLRYPLLGNRAEERIDQIIAEYSSEIAFLRRQIQLRASLRDLHEQYIQYWENHTNVVLARTFLQDKLQVVDRLEKRKKQGLLLQADELEFSSSFDKAVMDQSMHNQGLEQALERMRFLVGQDIKNAAPNRPDFSYACTDENMLKIAVRQSNPEIRLLETEQKKFLDSYTLSKWKPIKASAYAGLRFDDEPGREDGDRWGVGINFNLPANLKAAMRANQSKTRTAAQNAALEIQKRQLELVSEVTTAIDQFRTAAHGLQFAVKRLMATQEATREAWLRFQTLDGDVLEKLQGARYQYYRAATAGIAAQAKFFNAQAQLIHYLPEGCKGNVRPDYLDTIVQVDGDLAPPLLEMHTGKGTLPSVNIVGVSSSDHSLSDVDFAGIKMVSDQVPFPGSDLAVVQIDITQPSIPDYDIASVGAAPDPDSISDFDFAGVKMVSNPTIFADNNYAGINIAAADAAAVPASTMTVGKSTALYVWDSRNFFSVVNQNPEYLSELLDSGIRQLWISLDRAQINQAIATPVEIKSQIEQIRNRGIQVELLLGEPSWMTLAGRQDLLGIIKNLSTLPFDGLHLDLEPEQLAHYSEEPDRALRQLVDTLGEVHQVSPWPISFSTHYRNLANQTICLACEAHKLGVQKISLMIYASNPRRVVEIGKPIIDAHPGIKMSIAQSVEPSLSRDESLWHRSQQKMRESISQISQEIDTENFSGIAIQSWSHYYQHSES